MNEDGSDKPAPDVESVCMDILGTIQDIKRKGGMTVRDSNLLESLEKSIENHFTETKSNDLPDNKED